MYEPWKSNDYVHSRVQVVHIFITTFIYCNMCSIKLLKILKNPKKEKNNFIFRNYLHRIYKSLAVLTHIPYLIINDFLGTHSDNINLER